MTLTAVIVDDEPEAAEALRIKIEKLNMGVEVTNVINNPEEAIKYILNNPSDVLFLDINMPVLSGFDVADQLKHIPHKVVFVTAYNEYAIKAIKLHAFDYLLKPVNNSELKETIIRLQSSESKSNHSNIDSLKSLLKEIQPTSNKIMLSSLTDIVFVDLDQVIYIEAQGNYCNFHLNNGEQHLVTKTIGEYEIQLTNSGFFRVHKTYLVNLSHIARINKTELLVELQNGQTIEIASRRRNEFIEALQKRFKN